MILIPEGRTAFAQTFFFESNVFACVRVMGGLSQGYEYPSCCVFTCRYFLYGCTF